MGTVRAVDKTSGTPTSGSMSWWSTVDTTSQYKSDKETEMRELVEHMKPKGQFWVQSPHTDNRNGKRYPLAVVRFYQIKDAVFIKSGAAAGNGAVICVIQFNDNKYYGNAVCQYKDKFKFKKGAEVALIRALQSMKDANNRNGAKAIRQRVWNCFAKWIEK